METKMGVGAQELINSLANEVNKLKKRIELLENENRLTSSVLEKIWDNEYDAEWDEV